MFRVLCVISLACLASSAALAQRSPGFPQRSSTVDLQVRVVFEDDHPVGSMFQVDLISSTGATVSQGFTDDRGCAAFRVRPENYRVRITGSNIEELLSNPFTVRDREMEHVEYVSVHRNATGSAAGAPGTISVADLSIPAGAVSEYKKGNEALQKNNLPEARKHFDKAIKLYPAYAAAAYGAGLVESKAGDNQKAREYFEKTVSINDHFVPAYLSLASMAMKDSDYERADGLLTKATTAEPLNPDALMLAAQVDLMLKNFDGTIECTKRLHTIPHHPHPIVHFLAARAYVGKSRFDIAARSFMGRTLIDQAVAEYKQFLEEEPGNSNAPRAREELNALLKSQGPQTPRLSQDDLTSH